MSCTRFLFALRGLLLLALGMAAAAAPAQTAEAPAAAGSAPAQAPERPLPDLRQLNVAVPRPVRAATTALGLGRQRLALVVGVGTIGSKRVVDTAPRDIQAVAAALRAGGFVVMLREDLTARDLRASLKEYRERLLAEGVGFIYLTGLGAQLDGENHLLPRDTRLDAASANALAMQIRGAGVPIAEAVGALMGPPGSPRILVLDAAYRHPALAGLAAAGLAEQKLPPGVMALFGHALGSLQEVPAVAALPSPGPTDPRDIAASRFARVLVDALVTPRISGPEALRSTRQAIFEASQGQDSPWLAGDTEAREELAEASLLDGLVPRTPEDLAREGARQAPRLLTRGGRAGEQVASEALQQSGGAPATTPPATTVHAMGSQAADEATRLPGQPALPAGGVGSALGSAAGTAASVAGSVAAAGAGIRAAGAPAVAAVPEVAAPAVAAAMPATAVAPALAAPAAQRSERPVFEPGANPFGYAVGDTFTYQVIDVWKGEVTGQVTTAVEEVLEDGRLLANGQQVQMDPQGRLRKLVGSDRSVSEFEPSQELWWSNPRRGEGRSVEFKEVFQRADRSRGQTEWKGSSSVGSLSTIKLPAGEFEVLPIETSGWYYEKLANGRRTSGRFSRTVWYSAQLGHPVAIDLQDTDGTGRLFKRERLELLHAQTARAAPP